MGVASFPSLNPVCLILHVQKKRGCHGNTVSKKGGETACWCVRVWDWSIGMAKYVCLKGRQTFLQGMTGIKEDGGVFQSVCQWEGGRWGHRRGCLSVLVDPAGDCSQIQLIPTGCIHLSRTSDEEWVGGWQKKSREPWGTVFSVYQFIPQSTRDIGNYFHPSICQGYRVVCSFPLTCRAG